MDEIARLFDTKGLRKFLLEMATGTGKTLLCAALIRRFLMSRNAERVLFIVDRIELAKQTIEDFAVVLPEFKPVIYKTARRTGELLGASVVVATIQSLMTDRRYREEFTPFYFDLVINNEAHRSIYGDAREVVQFFQATRIGLTATPKAYLKNINMEQLTEEPSVATGSYAQGDGGNSVAAEGQPEFPLRDKPSRTIPTWEGIDTLVSQEVRIVGPNGEKVDIMTFRGGYERDIKEFVETTPALKAAVEAEDDDAIETILNERFYHRPEMYYSPDKLIISYGVPATTPAFVYNALGRKPLPTREAIITDTVDSIAARFNLRYSEQKWVDATAQLLAEDPAALRRFMAGDMTLFTASQFNQLGGVSALARFEGREQVFEALRQSTLVRQSILGA
jgi:hypothetical protein